MKQYDAKIIVENRTVELTEQDGLALPVKMNVPFHALKGVVGAILTIEAKGEAQAQAQIVKALQMPNG